MMKHAFLGLVCTVRDNKELQPIWSTSTFHLLSHESLSAHSSLRCAIDRCAIDTCGWCGVLVA